MTNKSPKIKSQWHERIGHCVIVISFVIGAWSFVISTPANAASVDEIQSTYSSIKDLTANFTQSTYVVVLDSTIKEPGIFMMKRPGKLFIEYTGEHPKRYISNGKKLWIIDKELEQVETHKVGGDTIPKEALEFLNGFSDMKGLFVVADRKAKDPKKGNTYLKLTPKGKSPQYKWLDCEFGPDNILKTMTIHNKSGNISTYVFNSVRLDSGLGDSIFELR